jgi:hypothetical protein
MYPRISVFLTEQGFSTKTAFNSKFFGYEIDVVGRNKKDEIVCAEAKLDSFGKAFRQIQKRKEFSNYNYVAIPIEIVNNWSLSLYYLKHQHLQHSNPKFAVHAIQGKILACQEAGIGLLAVGHNSVVEIIVPRKNEVPNFSKQKIIAEFELN